MKWFALVEKNNLRKKYEFEIEEFYSKSGEEFLEGFFRLESLGM